MAQPTPDTQQHRRRWPWVVAGLVVIVIVVSAAFALLVLRSVEDQQEGQDTLAATSVDESTLPQRVPFRYTAGHIVVDALPAGAEAAIPFVLDSGAPNTYSDDVADAYGGAARGHIAVAGIDGSVLQVPAIPFATLAIGEAVFEDAAGTRGWVEPANPLSCLTDNGLIGANLMKNAVWQIDYSAAEVTIAPSIERLEHVGGAIALAFTGNTVASPSPVLRFGGGDGELVFLVDTGSDGGLTVNPADLEAIGVTLDPNAPAIDLIVAGIAGTFETALTFAGVDLDIGGTAVAGYPIATLPSLAEGQGNIGNAFLDDFVVTIDWPNKTIYLDPVTADGSIPTPAVPAAATLSWDGDDIIVGSVARGSAAAGSGLAHGSAVASVEGVDYSDASRDDFCALFTSGIPDRYAITTAGGESYDIGPADGFYDALDG